MTELEVAWVAGIIEGEGCFGFNYKPRYKSPYIRVLMTDKDIIIRLKDLCGGKISYKKPGRIGYKPVWNWDLRRTHGLKYLLLQIRPWMGKRRGNKLQELLDHIESHPHRFLKIRKMETENLIPTHMET